MAKSVKLTYEKLKIILSWMDLNISGLIPLMSSKQNLM